MRIKTMAFTTLKINNKEVAKHRLNKNNVIKIGRLPENDIVIDNPAVSGRHAEIFWDEKGFIVKDTGSRNGTFIAGNPIKSRRLSEGDIITIGKHELVFSEKELKQDSANPAPESSSVPHSTQGQDQTIYLDTKKQKETLEKLDRLGQRKPLLVVKYKDKVLYKYLLKYQQTSIGRNPDNKIVIDNTAVSSRHAVITANGPAYTVEDLDSKNGTYVNKERIKTRELLNGDIIMIGRHEIVFEEGGTYTYDEIAQPLQSEAITAGDGTVCISTREYRKILSNDASTGLTFLKGGQGHVPINKNILKIGKNKSSDIVVKGFLVGDTAALIISKENTCYLAYKKGFAKPTVNGTRIKGTVKLKTGDIIQIGDAELKFNA